MRIKIGGYRRGPHQRPHGGNMSEIERIIHLFASMQILFGSRRGGVVPLIIVLLCVLGWLAYQFYPGWNLSQADRLWDSDNSRKKVTAIKKYKEILQGRDWFDSSQMQLKDGRRRLYQRIIEYHVAVDGNKQEAKNWIVEAWNEGIRADDLSFYEQETKDYYNEVTDGLKNSKERRRDRILNSPLIPGGKKINVGDSE